MSTGKKKTGKGGNFSWKRKEGQISFQWTVEKNSSLFPAQTGKMASSSADENLSLAKSANQKRMPDTALVYYYTFSS
jgi:hypothetical protein